MGDFERQKPVYQSPLFDLMPECRQNLLSALRAVMLYQSIFYLLFDDILWEIPLIIGSYCIMMPDDL